MWAFQSTGKQTAATPGNGASRLGAPLSVDLERRKNIRPIRKAKNLPPEYRSSAAGFCDTGISEPIFYPGGILRPARRSVDQEKANRIGDVFSQTDLARRQVDGWQRVLRSLEHLVLCICKPALFEMAEAHNDENMRGLVLPRLTRLPVLSFSITFPNNDFYDGDWVLGDLKMPGFLKSSMAAISWPPQIKVYMQSNDNHITELSCGDDFVYDSRQLILDYPVRNNAGPNTAIAALRGVLPGFSHLYWAGSDKVLRQRIRYDTQWLPADLIGDLFVCGPLGAALLGPFILNQLVEQTKYHGTFPVWAENNRQPHHAGIQALAQSVKELSKAFGTGIDDLVAKCKAQSLTVGKRFDDLYNKAHTVLVNAVTNGPRESASVDISSYAEEREASLEIHQGRLEGAQKHIEKLQKAKKDAEEKRDDTVKLRIVRDFFTLGLGEVGDWANLNDAMNHLDTLIDDANEQLTTCQTDKKSNSSAHRWARTQYKQAKSDLEGFDPILQAQLKAMTDLAARILELENRALEVGVALSSLTPRRQRVSAAPRPSAADPRATWSAAGGLPSLPDVQLPGAELRRPELEVVDGGRFQINSTSTPDPSRHLCRPCDVTVTIQPTWSAHEQFLRSTLC
ncbi:hypothetical protein B0H14DRAFT_3157856 [Mycena olivaceomarginata]|nr:hypothetical protein B0H14DRAFT_3157856 [Mycena olivaceomarginata]